MDTQREIGEREKEREREQKERGERGGRGENGESAEGGERGENLITRSLDVSIVFLAQVFADGC